jgi:transcriptional regulator with GAF, ATPase, and Fis domain
MACGIVSTWGDIMESAKSFLEAIHFFQKPFRNNPGSPEYNAAFCQILAGHASADAASIWQLDASNRLHLISSTDISRDQAMDITLQVGEGIGGAAALSRQPISVVNAQKLNLHDSRVDVRFGLQTYAMISAPVLFEDYLFGVVNILNHHSEKLFDPAWNEWLSALAVMYGAALAKAGNLVPYRAPSGLETGTEEKMPQSSVGKTVMVGISQAMQKILQLCIKAGTTDIPVLIYGETGTGKELAARRIHEASPRAQGPFLDVNCAGLSETLLESELFGHVKGAFTGATRNRSGKFVAASGGTLFLDEIGEMSDAFQSKILRVLEEKTVTPLGSEKPIPSDVRIIAATNKNLMERIVEKKFREDLYYRLCGIEITVPPLRERVEDIHLLALYCLNKAHAQQKSTHRTERPPCLSPEALALIEAYSWPGNVRQLEQALFAASALCEGDEITPADLPGWLHKAMAPPPGLTAFPENQQADIADTGQEEMQGLTKEEKARYISVLNATKYRGTGRWNISAAARELGIPRETLAYRLKKLRFPHG